MWRPSALAGVLLLTCAVTAHAQRLDRLTTTFDPGVRPAYAEDEQGGWRPLGVAKWSSAGVTLGTAVYGFRQQRRADREYEALERLCRADAERCAARLPDGAFADPELEALYQDVAALDQRARTALVVTQVGVAASVVLFMLDLRSARGPRNIPYDPDRLQLRPLPDGRLELRVSLPRR
jgi:hypothetical protein